MDPFDFPLFPCLNMQSQHGVTGLLVDVLATEFASPSSTWLLVIGLPVIAIAIAIATGLLVVVTGLLVVVLATGLFVFNAVPNKFKPSSAGVKSKNNAFGLPVEGADVISVSGANVDNVEGGLTEGSNVIA